MVSNREKLAGWKAKEKEEFQKQQKQREADLLRGQIESAEWMVAFYAEQPASGHVLKRYLYWEAQLESLSPPEEETIEE